MAAENGWTAEQTAHVQQAITVHEIGHQFGLGHDGTLVDGQPNSVMTVHTNDPEEAFDPNMGLHFNQVDLDKIRKHGNNPPFP